MLEPCAQAGIGAWTTAEPRCQGVAKHVVESQLEGRLWLMVGCWIYCISLNSLYISIHIWLVVWNIFYVSIYWECHHPNWPLVFRGVDQILINYKKNICFKFKLTNTGISSPFLRQWLDVDASLGLWPDDAWRWSGTLNPRIDTSELPSGYLT